MEGSNSTINKCRICKFNELIDVIDLGNQYITSRFPIYNDWSTPIVPISLCKCLNCDLLQLRQTTAASEMYEYEYGYRSGISNTMRNHLKQYQEEIISKLSCSLMEGNIVVDIGSNDSTMLQYYDKGLKRIGIDPTGSQFREYYGSVELLPTYFTFENFSAVYSNLKCKIVSSISMFYDLPDPVQFAKDIHRVLDDDGIWTCEQSYLFDMLERNSIDTICHEHLEYYSLHQIKTIATLADFKIIDVHFNDCNGGSFRIYFAKNGSPYKENVDLVEKILESERNKGVHTIELYTQFMKSCDIEVQRLNDFIKAVNNDDKQCWIYGASTKGNCLLQYAQLDEKKMRYAVERNPKKIGKMTSTGVPIISEETMRKTPPEFLLVLPWHFRDEIIAREREYLEKGGQLVFPFPHFEIYSLPEKPKVLITGSNGMIAQYVKQIFSSNYTLYGIAKEKIHTDTITTFYFNMTHQTETLEQTVLIIKPDIVVHLAGISSSAYALKNPIETLETNGLLTAQICEIIHRNGLKIKLFNASSSEIYKGHTTYNVKEDDTHMYHTHPYSIAKIMGHNTVKFYRETHGLQFSNGVLFTVESCKKNPEFLLNKVARHAKMCNGGQIIPLTVGNLGSYRNILHASDVAMAIKIIVEQKVGDDYLVCRDDFSRLISDLVVEIYKLNGFSLKKKSSEPCVYTDENDNVILIVNNAVMGHDQVQSHIQGTPDKLKKLGWTTHIEMDDILLEICK